MKKPSKLIKVLLTIGVIVYFIFYFGNNQEDYIAVLSVNFSFFIVIMLLTSLHFFLNGLFVLVILENFNKTISKTEAFYISVISSLGNYFLPLRGGAVIRSVYLKKVFNFSYSHFISTLYGNYVVIFWVNSFFALISLVVIQFKYSFVSIPLYIFFGLLFVSMLILSLIRFQADKIKQSKFELLNKFLIIFQNIIRGWDLIVINKKLLLKLIIVTVINFMLMTAIYILEFSALNIEVNIENIILYNCLSGVSLLVSLTPGSLGIREGIFIITSNILGISTDQVMQLALLDRGIIVITLIMWFLILSLVRGLSKKNEVETNNGCEENTQ